MPQPATRCALLVQVARHQSPGLRPSAGWLGRTAQQGPEADGSITLSASIGQLAPGTLVWSRVAATDGVDLVGEVEA